MADAGQPGAPLLARMTPVLDRAPPGPVVVAFSGGGDSTALLLLTAYWAAARGRGILAATVDHGLRPESPFEAARAAQTSARLGVPHETLRWTSWTGAGNLQDGARKARRQLIGTWARQRGAVAVILGHTLDDQAETFLTRLARGSGVDGLSGMAEESSWDRLVVLRPMLGLRRAALRDFLSDLGETWIEDPSNADPRFARVRMRQASGHLDALGLGAERLAETAAAMARARAALEHATAEVARHAVAAGPAGDVVLGIAALVRAPREIGLRVLAGTLAWISGDPYRPRLRSLTRAFETIAMRPAATLTLHGCVLRARDGRLVVRREPARVAPPVPIGAGCWDGRWHWLDVAEPALRVGALGEAGLARRGDWRASGLSREALLSTPAVWRGEDLVAAPLLPSGADTRPARVSHAPPPWEFTLLR